eukprot:3391949-Karenia_brevis.AAC.1
MGGSKPLDMFRAVKHFDRKQVTFYSVFESSMVNAVFATTPSRRNTALLLYLSRTRQNDTCFTSRDRTANAKKDVRGSLVRNLSQGTTLQQTREVNA